MDPGFGLWLFAVSLGASALGGMLGMASGIFIVPILTMFVHIDIRTAIGASIVSVIACSCASASPFLKGGLVNIRLAVGRRGRGDAGHFRCGKTGPITNVAKAMRQQLPPANNHLYEVIHEWRL